MLLSYFIKDDVSASCLSKFIVDNCSWNCGKEKHIEKYKNYEENVVCLEILNCQKLKIRIIVPSSHPINKVYHARHLVVVIKILVRRIRDICPSRIWINKIWIESYCSWTNQSKTNNNYGVVYNKRESFPISWEKCNETSSNFLIIDNG